jgi:hypothetical protein
MRYCCSPSSSIQKRKRSCHITRAIVVSAGVVGCGGTALATDMTGADLKAFLSGKTIYLELTIASASGTPGLGVIYWADGGRALYKTPSGAVWHGKWEIKANTICTDWNERPTNACVRYDKTGDTITVIDASSGHQRGTIVKTAVGNAEKL